MRAIMRADSEAFRDRLSATGTVLGGPAAIDLDDHRPEFSSSVCQREKEVPPAGVLDRPTHPAAPQHRLDVEAFRGDEAESVC